MNILKKIFGRRLTIIEKLNGRTWRTGHSDSAVERAFVISMLTGAAGILISLAKSHILGRFCHKKPQKTVESVMQDELDGEVINGYQVKLVDSK